MTGPDSSNATGAPRVEVRNETAFSVDGGAVERIAAAVLTYEECGMDLGVTFVSEEAMRRLNRDFRGIDDSTDVLAFPLVGREEDGWPEPGELELGDVVVCPAVAFRNARMNREDPAEELAVLVVHGTLHLLGWDHEQDEGEMAAREAELRRMLTPLRIETTSPDEGP